MLWALWPFLNRLNVFVADCSARFCRTGIAGPSSIYRARSVRGQLQCSSDPGALSSASIFLAQATGTRTLMLLHNPLFKRIVGARQRTPVCQHWISDQRQPRHQSIRTGFSLVPSSAGCIAFYTNDACARIGTFSKHAPSIIPRFARRRIGCSPLSLTRRFFLVVSTGPFSLRVFTFPFRRSRIQQEAYPPRQFAKAFDCDICSHIDQLCC